MFSKYAPQVAVLVAAAVVTRIVLRWIDDWKGKQVDATQTDEGEPQ